MNGEQPAVEARVARGGCACGQLTFEARGEPRRAGLCHCMTCRKVSGAAFNAFVIFRADRVTIRGEMRGWSATGEGERCFCPVCGSQVFDRGEADEIEIKLGAFDTPNLFAPTYEAWARRREAWLARVWGPDGHLIAYPEDRGERTS